MWWNTTQYNCLNGSVAATQNINVLIPELTDASQVIADFSHLTNIVIYFDEDVGKIRVKANAALYGVHARFCAKFD